MTPIFRENFGFQDNNFLTKISGQFTYKGYTPCSWLNDFRDNKQIGIKMCLEDLDIWKTFFIEQRIKYLLPSKNKYLLIL